MHLVSLHRHRYPRQRAASVAGSRPRPFRRGNPPRLAHRRRAAFLGSLSRERLPLHGSDHPKPVSSPVSAHGPFRPRWPPWTGEGAVGQDASSPYLSTRTRDDPEPRKNGSAQRRQCPGPGCCCDGTFVAASRLGRLPDVMAGTSDGESSAAGPLRVHPLRGIGAGASTRSPRTAAGRPEKFTIRLRYGTPRRRIALIHGGTAGRDPGG
jgi:hypothetical protein